MVELSGNTKIYGIIGDPIAHSISPAMFNAAFEHLGLNCVYVPFVVKRADLHWALNGIRALNISGVNITIPHKVEAIPRLDLVDSQAGEIDAVNTVVNRDGKLFGFNTDSGGFLKILEDRDITIKNKKVVLLGAGGASRAIAFVLMRNGAELTVMDRTVSRALELAQKYLMSGSGKVKGLELTESNVSSEITRADILINATSVGMGEDKSIVNGSLLQPSLVVFDAVYSPRKTKLLREAEEIGAITVEGVEMLIVQAALSFKLWTGLEAPLEVMKNAALKALGD